MLFSPDHGLRWRLADHLEAARNAKVLLCGWEGTLAPDPARGQPTPLPTEVTELVRPWVLEAEAAARGAAGSGGESVPWQQLLDELEGRLAAVYSVLLGIGREGDPGRAGAEALARAMTEDWIAGTKLFLRRLQADREELARWMGCAAPPAVVGVSGTTSDVHGRAGAVIRIEFAGGRTVFYKPRPVIGELLWAELNARLSEVDEEGSVVAARALSGGLREGSAGGGYGWMEGLDRGDCDEERHWRRAGVLLCLAQHVGLGDLQMSNVLATDAGPSVLDAECLGGVISPMPLDAEDAMERDLLATGLLPRPLGFGELDLPDVSGLFGGAASVRGVLLPFWTASETGAAELCLAGARLLEQGNRHAGRRNTLACLPELIEGYLRGARALLAVRTDLLAEAGWVERLGAQHAPRVVLRSTLSYGDLLGRAVLFGLRASEEERRMGLRQVLERMPIALPGGATPEVLAAESEALGRMCVPRFYLACATKDVAAETNVVVAQGVAGSSPAEAIRRRLEGMSLPNLDAEVRSVLPSILFRARQL